MKKNKKTGKPRTCPPQVNVKDLFLSGIEQAQKMALSALSEQEEKYHQKGIVAEFRLFPTGIFGLLTHNGDKDYAFCFDYEEQTQGEFAKHKIYIFAELRLGTLMTGPGEHLFNPLLPGDDFISAGIKLRYCLDRKIVPSSSQK